MNNCNKSKINNQVVNDENAYLKFVNPFKCFVNKYTENTFNANGHKIINVYGYVDESNVNHICECGCKMHIHSKRITNLKHTASLSAYISIKVDNTQYICPNCGKTIMNNINFKSKNHLITKQLYTTIEDLLASNKYTLTTISELTGVCRNIIKDIDKQRLKKLYLDKKGNINKPTEYSKYIAIDEFSLHKGHKYATHIIDWETGHVLWIAI